jgi:hypothetical protein
MATLTFEASAIVQRPVYAGRGGRRNSAVSHGESLNAVVEVAHMGGVKYRGPSLFTAAGPCSAQVRTPSLRRRSCVRTEPCRRPSLVPPRDGGIREDSLIHDRQRAATAGDQLPT